MNFYNEFDSHAAAWLRQLIADGLIPPGIVDQRSITELTPNDLDGFTQCHFFCGIAGWSLALKLAGWPTDKPVWTGSCPCQPFSVAGKGKGSDDERHLWPAFFNLIRECRPDVVFGEQVESAVGHGWLDDIRADLEAEGYACGDCTMGAHSAGADHQRQRLYWVAKSGSLGHGECKRVTGAIRCKGSGHESEEPEPRGATSETINHGPASGLCGVANSGKPQREKWEERDPARGETSWRSGERFTLERTDGHMADRVPTDGTASGLCGMGDPDGKRKGTERRVCEGAESKLDRNGQNMAVNHWADSCWIYCRDGKHRRVPTLPSLFPLVDGVSYKLARRGSVRPALLKGAGNAIVPQVAAMFIEAFDGAELL